MATTEIKKLRYCYEVLRRRIADEDDGLAYWQMNLKIATYFLRRYDTEFVPADSRRDEVLPECDETDTRGEHPLLQRPSAENRSYPKLTDNLKRDLEKRVAKDLEPLTKRSSHRERAFLALARKATCPPKPWRRGKQAIRGWSMEPDAVQRENKPLECRLILCRCS